MSNNQTSQVQTSTQREPEREHRIFTFKATQLVWLVFGVLEALIILRIFLKLVGANAASPFAVFIYGFTGFFLSPFNGLVGTPTAGNIQLEITSFIALIVYALMAWGLERLIWLIFYRPRGPVVAVTQTNSTNQHTPM